MIAIFEMPLSVLSIQNSIEIKKVREIWKSKGQTFPATEILIINNICYPHCLRLIIDPIEFDPRPKTFLINNFRINKCLGFSYIYFDIYMHDIKSLYIYIYIIYILYIYYIIYIYILYIYVYI